MSLKNFDPNAAATGDSGIFGLPFDEKDATVVYLPVPWEATTSYGGGTSEGPRAILEASRQVDLFDLEVDRPYEAGLHMLPESAQVLAWNEEAKEAAQRVIEVGGQIEGDPELAAVLERVNSLSERVNEYVENETRRLLAAGKLPVIVGGDHSVPYGAFRAVGERHPGFGILHFDAHSDTRDAYEGFRHSHASIMRNALDGVPQIKKLVQVGIRDFCEEEVEYCRAQGERVRVFYDAHLAHEKFAGTPWSKIAQTIVRELPREVWISFDVDGLDPRYCPHTGTPVPGGLEFHEALYLVEELVRTGRRIVGFDLNEVAPDPTGQSEWDANVGARLLYKMTAWMLASQGKRPLR